MSFAPDLNTRSVLLQLPIGNLLIYANGRTTDVADRIEALGGDHSHFVTHWHEAAMGAVAIAQRTGAPVHCHATDREQTEMEVAIAGSFDTRHAYADDLEIIPIPGHTPGATAILWRGPQHRCLFTGDSLFVSAGEWRVAVLESSDRAAYLESLATIATLDFDLLVPWVAAAGAEAATHVSRGMVQRKLDAIIDRVRAAAKT